MGKHYGCHLCTHMVTSHMNTAQESLANSVFPPPCSAENVAQQDRADLPTNKANNNQFANDDQVVERQKGVPTMPLLAHEKVNAYHVPPSRYAPRADAYRHDDTLDLPPETDPLPERCQFMFSDGRQCTMARSDIHPSLCRFHSEREDQLFGDPVAGGMVVGAALDLPELYSACRDLTTASGVNRALAQVFRLLAQRRISRQEAATFAKLGHLLLQSISAARTSRESDDATSIVVPSEYHERGAQFASRKPWQESSPEPSLQHTNGGSARQPAPS